MSKRTEYIPRLGVRADKKAISQGNLNKRADKKLDIVVQHYQRAIGKCIDDISSIFFKKTIYLKDLRYLDEMELSYRIEDRFFARSYNLYYRTTVEDLSKDAPEADCSFGVKLKGGMRIQDAQIICKEGIYESDEMQGYLTRLNIPLIIDRIVVLDITEFEINYKVSSGEWDIKFGGLIGSTTWNFIPPMMQLIKPRDDECVKVIEIFELVIDALINRNSFEVDSIECLS